MQHDADLATQPSGIDHREIDTIDQYAAAFGGFNLIEFMPSGNNVHPLRIPEDVVFELEESLVLFDTGMSHNSGELHEIQKTEMSTKRGDEMLAQMTEFCLEMNRALARSDLRRLGEGLHEAWLLKKKTSPTVSTGQIDQIYERARAAGRPAPGSTFPGRRGGAWPGNT